MFIDCSYILLGSRKKKGRFINCFAVAILKFKMATILDIIWQYLSNDSGWKMISKCVCTVMRHIVAECIHVSNGHAC